MCEAEQTFEMTLTYRGKSTEDSFVPNSKSTTSQTYISDVVANFMNVMIMQE